MPLLALLVLAFRSLLPMAVAPQAVWTSTHIGHAHHAHHTQMPSADESQPNGGDNSGLHHQTCHFCRFQDAALLPPSQQPAARTSLPILEPWQAARPHLSGPSDVFTSAWVRAPPVHPV
ncbi:DUF2946 family protein [Azospirillum canadense]|uniref:DUF2946 family protein n=1 Tax=Azospirillum canadense TaxID=403962 RepID=UPI00222736D6|nr:DUF2946 family protein [Azospirillum canadense]MCW2241483.1 hypothetical protein [Azospirillum canadense]